MQVSLKEIMVQYATQKGGGLPLSPQEICNAVVQWVQEYTKNTLVDIDTIRVQTLESLIEGSETVVVDLNEQGTKLEIHLDYDVIQKIDRALILPLSPPVKTMIVGVTSSNEQVLLDKSLYIHNIILKNYTDFIHISILNKTSSPYSSVNDVITDIRNGKQWCFVSGNIGVSSILTISLNSDEANFSAYYFSAGAVYIDILVSLTLQSDNVEEL